MPFVDSASERPGVANMIHEIKVAALWPPPCLHPNPPPQKSLQLQGNVYHLHHVHRQTEGPHCNMYTYHAAYFKWAFAL